MKIVLPITVLLILAAFVFGFLMDLFLSIVVIILTSMAITTYIGDKKSGWDSYAAVLPVSKKEMVLSKYVLACLLALSGAVLALLTKLVNGLVTHNGSIADTFIMIYALFAASVMLISLLLPFEYVLNEEQARFLLVPAVMISMTAFYIFRQIQNMQTIVWILILSPFLLSLLFALSFMVSSAIYRRRYV